MKTTTNTNATSNNKPVHKIRLGSISAAIWENAFDTDKTTHRRFWSSRTATPRGTGRRPARFAPRISCW